MAIDTAELEQMRDTLLRARASGTLSVRHADGRQVTYQDSDAMARSIADLEARIKNHLAAGTRPASVWFSTGKGVF